MRNAHKIGAIFYILWGILHIVAGAMLLTALSTEGGIAYVRIIGSAMPATSLQSEFSEIVKAIFLQHAWNLIIFGVVSIIIAVFLNLKNSRRGYWLNLFIVTAVDLAYIIFILVPGYIDLKYALWGPSFGFLAVIFSTIGIFSHSR